MSQRVRKRIEQCFGRAKEIGGLCIATGWADVSGHAPAATDAFTASIARQRNYVSQPPASPTRKLDVAERHAAVAAVRFDEQATRSRKIM